MGHQGSKRLSGDGWIQTGSETGELDGDARSNVVPGHPVNEPFIIFCEPDCVRAHQWVSCQGCTFLRVVGVCVEYSEAMTTMQTDSEARLNRLPRLPSNERVLLSGRDNARAWTINWGCDGICVLAEATLDLDEEVQVELPERHARGTARVIWAQHHQDGTIAGLEFIALERRAA